MQLLGAAFQTCRLGVVATRAPGVVDVTDQVERLVTRAGIEDGIAWIFCRHTTCGITINELEDGLVEDFQRNITALVGEGYYAHDDLSRRTQNLQGPDEPPNGSAHVRQMLFGATSQMVPIVDGRLGLGTWQRVLFIELDTPRPRTLLITTLG